MINVEDLPEEQLKKSKTWLRYVDAFGSCTACGEHCSLLDPCCGSPVWFEGGTESFDSLWEQIEDELKDAAIPDYDAQAKDNKLDGVDS
jgi:hypothetical protein